MTAGPWVDIDLGAVCANYTMLCDGAPDAETAAVVKCDAYGLGMKPVATALAERAGCNTFFVVYPEEGLALRDALKTACPSAKIYIFNGPQPGMAGLFESAGLTPVLNNYDQAKRWADEAPGAPAALHIDTGMNRLGAPLRELTDIASLATLNIELAISHLACASDPAHPKNAEQRALFIEASGKFPDARKSLSASGGAMMSKDYHFDLLRPGIALYGGTPFDKDDERLTPVAALRAPVVQIRHAAPGETVGYGATFPVTRPTTLATVALGYGDGFPRAGSNRAEAFIGGARAKIAGRVSMDLISLDVTGLPTAPEIGDAATFLGDGVSLFEAAEACGTAPYEMLTGLGGRVDRRYL